MIIRVGDKTSIFNSAFTYFLTQQAEALAKKDKSFKYQRALMPGGTCEATVYDAWGYIAAAVCVPLGNYHNMDRAQKEDRPGVHRRFGLDEHGEAVRAARARMGDQFSEDNSELKKRVVKRFSELKRFLTVSCAATRRSTRELASLMRSGYLGDVRD